MARRRGAGLGAACLIYACCLPLRLLRTEKNVLNLAAFLVRDNLGAKESSSSKANGFTLIGERQIQLAAFVSVSARR